MSRPLVRVAPSTGWVDVAGVVYAARLPDGPPLVLAGPGAVVWHAVMGGGSLDDVVVRVSRETGESAADVRPGVEGFVTGLVDAGVLVVAPAPGDG